MGLNFCTLFDSNYLLKGLALYESLVKQCKTGFHLYIFPFDDISYDILKKLTLINVTIISLEEFEDKELIKVKPSRTKGEYCWTCTPSIILYSITKFNLSHCTYLDADIYFFSDPSVLISEMDSNSVLITPHWYLSEYDRSQESGIYCVHFTTFRNDAVGLGVLEWWRKECINWCYNRHENGKFGDQKYLDDWPQRFKGVHILQNRGGGIAPWNSRHYKFYKNQNEVIFGVFESQNFIPVFFHFHELSILSDKEFDLSGYKLSREVINYFYKPYALSLHKNNELLKNIDVFIAPPANIYRNFSINKFYINIRRLIKGTYNFIKL